MMPMVAFTTLTPVQSKFIRKRLSPSTSTRVLQQPKASLPQVSLQEPLLIRAARGQPVPRPPVWLMRQAGRYMAAFREYSDRYPFRHRSETPDIAVELSMQPFRAFGTDAIIMFSDILTPLTGIGIHFDIKSGTGPVITEPIRSLAQVEAILAVDFDPQASLPFVSQVLGTLKSNLVSHPDVALLGFVAAPFTLASYIIEGRAAKNITHVKRFMYADEDGFDVTVLHRLLDGLSDMLAKYAIYQLDSGAQAVQLFDSWAHHLSPHQYAKFALPYAQKVARIVKEARPDAVIIFFANGSAGKLDDIADKMTSTVDVIGLDWSVKMSDARRVFGDSVVLQGNVDPSILTSGSEESIRRAVRETVDQAGSNVILNLGHGVIQTTPEASVNAFVDEAKSLSF